MKSLFNDQQRKEITDRIASVANESERKWGKMSAAQMLVHCQQPIKVGLGELKLGTNLLFMILGPFIKKKLMKEVPFDQNLPTHKDFIITHEPSLVEERQKLIDLVNQFNDKKDSLAIKHPIFGKMSTQQWDSLNWKHLDHHLRQFGI